jgi:RNA polymerase sigma-70 factor (ECF subfamily)
MSINSVGANVNDSAEKIRLVKLAQAGDTLAFEKLYSDYSKVILFLTQKYLWKKEDVEDVAQNAILNMLRGLKKLKNPAVFDAWLHSIVKNACYNHNKLYSRDRENEDADETSMDVVEETCEYIPEESLLKSEVDSEIIAALNKLSDCNRQALYLYYYKQLSYKEIAAKLGVTASTVSTNILRGKRQLKEMLEEPKELRESKIGGRNSEDLLRGVAIGPMLAHAFFVDEVDCGVGASDAERLVQGARHKIELQQAKAQNLGNRFKPKIGGGAVAAIIVGVAVVVTSITILVTPGVAAISSAPAYTAPVNSIDNDAAASLNAEIVFAGGSDAGADILNPVSASLETDAGIAENWCVVDSDNQTVLRGNGATIGDELSQLLPGEYNVEWTIVLDDGAFVTATRMFEVRD